MVVVDAVDVAVAVTVLCEGVTVLVGVTTVVTFWKKGRVRAISVFVGTLLGFFVVMYVTQSV